MRYWSPLPPTSPAPPSADVAQVLIAAHHAARDAELALPLALATAATFVLCAVLCLLSWGALAAQNERIRAVYELEERERELLERGTQRSKTASRVW